MVKVFYILIEVVLLFGVKVVNVIDTGNIFTIFCINQSHSIVKTFR